MKVTAVLTHYFYYADNSVMLLILFIVIIMQLLFHSLMVVCINICIFLASRSLIFNSLAFLVPLSCCCFNNICRGPYIKILLLHSKL